MSVKVKKKPPPRPWPPLQSTPTQPVKIKKTPSPPQSITDVIIADNSKCDIDDNNQLSDNSDSPLVLTQNIISSINTNETSTSYSHSHSMSRIQDLIEQQQEYQKNKIQITQLQPINNELDDDDDDDPDADEKFTKILINFTRQESLSQAKRSSLSSKNGQNMSWIRKKSPNRALNQIGLLSKNVRNVKANKSLLTAKGTRSRRAGTAAYALNTPPSPLIPSITSISVMNKLNNNIKLPSTSTTLVNRNQSYDNTNPSTDTSMPPDIDHFSNAKSTPIIESPAINGIGGNINIVGDLPGFDLAAQSVPAHKIFNNNSSGQLHLVPIDVKVAMKTNSSNDIVNIGSITPNRIPFTNGFNYIKHPISRHQSTPIINADDDDMDQNDNVLSDGVDSDDDDDNDNDQKIQDVVQNEIVFQTTAQELMISCSNPRDVFFKLRKVCIDLKKDNLLPIKLSSSGKLLSNSGVDSFLILLGFVENPVTNEWICSKSKRCAKAFIDVAAMQCHKCYMELQNQESTIVIIKKQRSINSLNKLRSSMSKSKSISKTNSISRTASTTFTIQQNNTNLFPSTLTPEPLNETKSYEDFLNDKLDDNDETVQLYELIWGITHVNNTDHAAGDVLLLCYPLVTTPKQLLLCCEARIFRDDHDGRVSQSVQSISNVSNTASTTATTATNTTPTTISHMSLPSFSSSKSNLYDRVLSSFSVQAKVINFLTHWMNNYWSEDWDSSNKLISYMRQFIHRYRSAISSDYDNLDDNEIRKANVIISMLEKTMNVQKKKQKLKLNKVLGNDNKFLISPKKSDLKSKSRSTSPRKSFGHIKSRSKFGFGGSKHNVLPNDVSSIDSIIIAEQITFKQFKLFQKIHSRECLNQSWKNKKFKHILAPNITAYIDEFNKITKWIQGSVLLAKSVKYRGKILKKWVKVSEELYKLRNFQALFAVHCALQSTPIYRLKDAWSFVAKKKKHMNHHNMIKVIMKSTGNWKNLRRLQSETHPPMLPYFGMFAQDLIVIEETTKNRKNNGAINWDALCKINKQIDKHLIYQNTPYNQLEQDATIQRWMNKELNVSNKLEDEWIYMVSTTIQKQDENEMGNKSIKFKQQKAQKAFQKNKKRTKSFGIWNK